MSTIQRATASEVPPLVAGERLTQPDFHERYLASPPDFRAELIEGVVYMPSPVRPWHSEVNAAVVGWLGQYAAATPGVVVGTNGTTVLDQTNEVQPDAMLRIREDRGGQSRDLGGYIAGAPELVVEVAHASRNLDLGPRRNAYERAGVQEYVVVAREPEEVLWFVLKDQGFRQARRTRGLYRSTVFPGLWLDADALLKAQLAELQSAVTKGLSSPDHRAFVERLASRAKGGP